MIHFLRNRRFLAGWIDPFAACALVVVLAASGATLAQNTHYDAAVAAFEARDYTKAAQQFEAVVDEHPTWAPGLKTLGQCYYLLGRAADGESKLEQVRQLDPESDMFTVNYAVGQTLYQERKYQNSIAPLERALDLADLQKRSGIVTSLAHAHLKMKQFTEARRLLEGQTHLDARSSRYLAFACQQSGDYDCALATLRSMRGAKSEDGAGNVVKDLAEWSSYWATKPANAGRAKQLLAQAVTDTQGWFEAEPSHDKALQTYAAVLLAAERPDELIAAMQLRVGSGAKGCAARLMLACAHNAKRNSAEAERWAREETDCNATSVEGRLELAAAMMRQLRPDFSTTADVEADLARAAEATAAVAKARSLDPSNQRAVSLAADLRTATDRLQGVAKDLKANDKNFEDDVNAEDAKAVRERCKNILWKMNNQNKALPDGDQEFYDKHNCKPHAAP